MTDTIRIPVGPSGKRVAWAVIDVDDYERVIEHSWYLNRYGYAFSPNAVQNRGIFLHGFILGRRGEDDGLHVDHLNRDRLDNRRANLRVVTVSENVLNSDRHDGRDEKIARVRGLKRGGASAKEAATTAGVSITTVHKWTRDFPRPESRGSTNGTTYRAVERGIYQRHYVTSGITLEGFYCHDGNRKTFIKFGTLEDARAYRVSDAWRKERELNYRNFRNANARKTHCKRGHSYDETNTYVSPRGDRQCRACNEIAVRRYRERTRTAA